MAKPRALMVTTTHTNSKTKWLEMERKGKETVSALVPETESVTQGGPMRLEDGGPEVSWSRVKLQVRSKRYKRRVVGLLNERDGWGHKAQVDEMDEILGMLVQHWFSG